MLKRDTQDKKFLWELVLVSLIGGVSDAVTGSGVVTTWILCAGGGMLGGMLS